MNAEAIRKERERVLNIYTPLNVAKKEILKRWKNQELREKVIKAIGGELPDPFFREPRAVISRHIISPNIEFRFFYDLAKEAGLNPLGLEGVIDKFCTTNPEKAALGKMKFIKNGNNDNKTDSYVKTINLSACEGKKLCEIETLWGENFVDFHHRVLNAAYPNFEIFDDFVWLKNNGHSIEPTRYYEKYLSLFLCFGVLFENFYINKHEIKFTDEIVLPVFEKIEKEFGLKPLIVPLVPIEDETHNLWKCYPDTLKELAKKVVA